MHIISDKRFEARRLAKREQGGPDAEYIGPLYRMAISNTPNERIADWMAVNGLRYSNQLVKRTLRMAHREDLIGYLIKEEEIDINDTVKSRMTARVGKVIGVRPDGDIITVKWDTGGSQLIPKESVFKLRTQEIVETKDFSKVQTSTEDTYKAMNEKKVFVREQE